MKVSVLQHSRCGHAALWANDSSRIQHVKDHLEAVGYFNWRVRTVDLQPGESMDSMAGMCDTCAIDPSRALLLKSETGGCKVCGPSSVPFGGAT